MVYKAMKEVRAGRLTEVQDQYIEILVNEYFTYFGRLPYGVRGKIAERLGCSRSYLSQLDNGANPVFTRERNRRFREMIPIADSTAQLGMLQEMMDDALEGRRNAGKPLTSKDPADLLALANQIAGDEEIVQAPAASQSVTFNFSTMSDDQLSRAIQWVSGKMRDDDLDELGDVIDGAFKQIPAEAVGDGAD